MSDDTVSTRVHIANSETLTFQHYFVRDKCAPIVTGFEFAGIDSARPSPGFSKALASETLACVLICPSNPFVSVDPVLKIPGVMEALKKSNAPVVAVSPIVGGRAIKGPAAKMMRELGMPQTALAVATHYQGRIDGFVIDEADKAMQSDIEALGIPTLVTDTVMVSLQDRVDLAAACLQFVSQITA